MFQSGVQKVCLIMLFVAVTVYMAGLYDTYRIFGYRIRSNESSSTTGLMDAGGFMDALRQCSSSPLEKPVTSEVVSERIDGYDDDALAKAWSKVPVRESPELPRLLTPLQLNTSIELLSRVASLFDQHGIEYVLCYGTLLGSYVAHSVMAWDDDVDLVIHERYQPLLQELGSNKTLKHMGFGYHYNCVRWGIDQCDMAKNKIWLIGSYWSTGHTWLHPFIDVITYDNNNTHVWMRNHINDSVVMPTATFYPLQKRPLNGLWFNAPSEPYAFLVNNYWAWSKNESARILTCSWPHWNHWAEKAFKGWRNVDCAAVVQYYPFVRRYKTSSGKTQEDLVLNNVSYYTIVTPETFEPAWLPEPHRLQWFEHWGRNKRYSPPPYIKIL